MTGHFGVKSFHAITSSGTNKKAKHTKQNKYTDLIYKKRDKKANSDSLIIHKPDSRIVQ